MTLANQFRWAFVISTLGLANAPWTFEGGLAAAERPASRGRPNILLLLTDDQRADTIHALGNETIITPNLDRLAQEGYV